MIAANRLLAPEWRSSIRTDVDGRISPGHQSHEQRPSSNSAPSGRALVVGHVVVHLNLARDDVLLHLRNEILHVFRYTAAKRREIHHAIFDAEQQLARHKTKMIAAD